MKNNSSFLIMAICLFLLQGCTIDYANAVDITLKNNLDSPITVVIQNRDLASQYDIAIIDRKCEHRIVHSGYMSGSPDIEHNDMIAFHPGYYIKEIIESSGMHPEDFAERIGITADYLHKLLDGEEHLAADTAAKLSSLLGTSARYWLNLQESYTRMDMLMKSS